MQGLNLGKPPVNPVDQVKENELSRQIKNPPPNDPPVDPKATDEELMDREQRKPDDATATNAAEAVAEVAPADKPEGTNDLNQPADESSPASNRDPNAEPEVIPPEQRLEDGAKIASAEGQGAQAQIPEPLANQEPVIFSSHPIMRFRVGRKWQFENGQLKLTPEQAEVFRDELSRVDVKTRNQVKELDVAAAEAFIANIKPVATKKIDSVDALTNAQTEIGTEELRSAT